MPRERTLTAVLTPFGADAAGVVPVLHCVGRADGAPVAEAVRALGVGPELEIGRALLGDPLVSGRHARVRAARRPVGAEGGDGPLEISVEDLASKNGTFVDGQRLAGAARLGVGGLLFVGAHAFVLRNLTVADREALGDERSRPLGPVASAAPALARVLFKLRRLARTEAEILLLGETGVGKEVYARALHAASGRAGRFVPINCAALPRELVESELFGYRAGAHSTALQPKRGLLEEADGGTLFLDEVGEMPPEAQSKLLRFLQDRELVPLGQTRPRRLDVRVLAATNRPASGGHVAGLRDDLLARLGAAPLELPPLRDRIEDLGALAAHLLRATAAGARFEVPAFRALCLHRWPLNVRELEKVLQAAAAFAGDRSIALHDLPPALAAGAEARAALAAPEAREGTAATAVVAAPAAAPSAARKPAEPGPSADEIERHLVASRGNVADVARALGRQRAAVWRWIKQYGLDPERHRGAGRGSESEDPD
jgi:DNA-binding NtrC family response regulator